MMMTRTVYLLLGAAFLACRGEREPDPEPPSLIQFDTAHVRIVSRTDTVRLRVELARSATEKTMGLMERTSLADSAGMLFIYDSDQPATAGFWMFRTRIPLDIAFLDSTGVIRSIKNMVPCTTATAARCPTYEPGVPYRVALEVPAGFFQRKRFGVGDRVMLEDVAK